MWYLSEVPKVIHFYWGLNEKFSYLRYVSVKSFLIHNPDWKILFHVPKFPCYDKPPWEGIEQKGSKTYKDCFPLLLNLKLTIVEHDFTDYGFFNNVHEVYKNDYLRWYLLSHMGGLWSDTDILYVKSIEDIIENSEQNKNLNTFLCKYPSGANAIGFLLSSSNNPFFRDVQNFSIKIFHDKDYQSIGSIILNLIFEQRPEIASMYSTLKFHFLNPSSVYSINCEWDAYVEFYRPLNNFRVKEGVIGYHWYAGAPITQYYENLINETNYQTIGNLIGKLVCNIEDGVNI